MGARAPSSCRSMLDERDDRAPRRRPSSSRSRCSRGGAARDARAGERDRERGGERRAAGRSRRRRSSSSAQRPELVDVELDVAAAHRDDQARARRRPRRRRPPSRRSRTSGRPRGRHGARTRSARGSPPLSMISTRKQDDQRAAAHEHAERADDEEHPARIDVPGDVRAGMQPVASSIAGWRHVAWEPSTTPPTAATSSTIEVTSNAIRWSVRNSRPIESGEPNDRVIGVGVRERAAGRQPDRDDDLGEDRAAASTAPTTCQDGPPAHGRLLGAVAEVGDHEQEHHHHRAAVDEHLRRGDELAAEQQVEHGERGEVPDQRERREERVAEA